MDKNYEDNPQPRGRINLINDDDPDPEPGPSTSRSQNVENDDTERHPVRVSGEYICDVCNKVLASAFSLKRHKTTIHNVPTFYCSCNECGKTTNRRDNHLRHIHGHLMTRDYSCEFCGHRTKFLASLKRHVLIHSTPKFKCDVCAKSFRERRQMVEHRSIHLGEKIFHCYFCNYKGRTADLRRKHMKNKHAGNYSIRCDRCGNFFPSREVMLDHRNIHSCVVN